MKRILIIEDEPAMRANLRDILEMEDFAPLLAAGCAAAVSVALAQSPATMAPPAGFKGYLAPGAAPDTLRILPPPPASRPCQISPAASNSSATASPFRR